MANLLSFPTISLAFHVNLNQKRLPKHVKTTTSGRCKCVKNAFNPSKPGTVIRGSCDSHEEEKAIQTCVKGFSTLDNVSLFIV